MKSAAARVKPSGTPVLKASRGRGRDKTNQLGEDEPQVLLDTFAKPGQTRARQTCDSALKKEGSATGPSFFAFG